MPGGLYCIQQDILSVHSPREGHQHCLYVPAGTVISVRNHDQLNDRLVEVNWDSKTVLVFAQDLEDRAQPLNN